MRQWLKELWCFFNGHDWTEFTDKAMGNYTYYSDRKCGCCGKLEMLKNGYVFTYLYKRTKF